MEKSMINEQLFILGIFEKLIPIDARHIRLCILKQFAHNARFINDTELDLCKHIQTKANMLCSLIVIFDFFLSPKLFDGPQNNLFQRLYNPHRCCHKRSSHCSRFARCFFPANFFSFSFSLSSVTPGDCKCLNQIIIKFASFATESNRSTHYFVMHLIERVRVAHHWPQWAKIWLCVCSLPLQTLSILHRKSDWICSNGQNCN